MNSSVIFFRECEKLFEEEILRDIQAAYFNCDEFNNMSYALFKLPDKYKNIFDTKDLVRRLKKFYRIDWFRDQTASWNNEKTVEFTENFNVGLCFTFNADSFGEIYKKNV